MAVSSHFRNGKGNSKKRLSGSLSPNRGIARARFDFETKIRYKVFMTFVSLMKSFFPRHDHNVLFQVVTKAVPNLPSKQPSQKENSDMM